MEIYIYSVTKSKKCVPKTLLAISIFGSGYKIKLLHVIKIQNLAHTPLCHKVVWHERWEVDILIYVVSHI